MERDVLPMIGDQAISAIIGDGFPPSPKLTAESVREPSCAMVSDP
jgi:hypothetical protein